jgi:DNA-binding CsgD family transcriptional regulator
VTALTRASELSPPCADRSRRLARAGLTNKQIGERLYLSHRTVGAHLYRAFGKLGISTRATLRDALAAPGGHGVVKAG